MAVAVTPMMMVVMAVMPMVAVVIMVVMAVMMPVVHQCAEGDKGRQRCHVTVAVMGARRGADAGQAEQARGRDYA